MWASAHDFAQQRGLKVPLLADVTRVERLAAGHSDYSSKWSLYIVELMLEQQVETAA